MSEPPIYDGVPPTDRQLALAKLWDELEKDQLATLDAANKRIIELVTALLGLFLALLAFGKDYPPPYLKDNTVAQLLAVATLLAYLAALLAATWGLSPQDYAKYDHNLTGMREELARMAAFKKQRYRLAMWLFAVGSILLAVFIGSLLLG